MVRVIGTPAGRRGGHTSQHGQALILTLLFAGATGVITLLLYNSGMLANTKSRLQNAADAAAYSAAVMLARDHNFSAYTNRAMVANQVAVAQLVSLKSYLDDAKNTHGRLSGVPLAAEALIPVSKSPWNIGKKVPMGAAQSGYAAIAGGAVKSLDLLINAFDTSQELHHQATALNVLVVADEVAKKNDPKSGVTTGVFQVGNSLVQLAKWDTAYTKRYRANDASTQADRFADVVVSADSTDGFVRNRTSVPVPSWSSVPYPWFCPIGIPKKTAFGFVHGGGTILSSNKRRWLALDATMGGGFFQCYYITPWGTVTVTVPLIDLGGSGGAVAGAGGDYNENMGYHSNPFWTKLYGGALIDPATAIPGWIRYKLKGPGASLDGGGGLQKNYRDMAALNTKPANQSAELNGGAVPLTIEVEHKGADIRTAAKVIPNPGEIALADGLKGNTMRALASAHPYFYRANSDASMFTKAGWKRADGKTEMANLFNPYWQARLVDRTEAERLMSVGAQ